MAPGGRTGTVLRNGPRCTPAFPFPHKLARRGHGRCHRRLDPRPRGGAGHLVSTRRQPEIRASVATLGIPWASLPAARLPQEQQEEHLGPTGLAAFRPAAAWPPPGCRLAAALQARHTIPRVDYPPRRPDHQDCRPYSVVWFALHVSKVYKKRRLKRHV